MQEKIYFISLKSTENINKIHQKINKLYENADFDNLLEHNDLVAIKIHFGERKNVTHIPPNYLLPITQKIRQRGAKPFLTDTNVLYKSSRSEAVSHLLLAHEHGFTPENCGAPVIITDGLRGSNETEIKIPGKLFDKVSIATEALTCNAMFVISHATGHMATGLAGAIKNLGMGLASRKGKLRQHSSVKPWIDKSNCTACELCIKWCPENAIELKQNHASIQGKKCIGCGECITVCRFGAVRYNWRTSIEDLQKKIAEHALGATITKKGKIAYFNFLINITKDCDCMGGVQDSIMPDIGVLAGNDPIAIDKASMDLIEKHAGKSIAKLSYPHINETIQLLHGQEIGLGTMEYQLIEIH